MAEIDKKLDVAATIKTAGASTVSDVVNRTTLAAGAISLDTAIGDNFYGINHRQTPGAVPINKDSHGLTFFTRPEFNLSTVNIRAIRQLIPLLTSDEASVQRVIRCLLDPRLQREGTPCQFVDANLPFISVLTNNLLSMSGWPDVEVDTFTSSPGIYKEAWFIVDSLAQNLSTYDITATFRNIDGDPITLLFFIWAHYSSLVYQGLMIPYPEKIIRNEIDYLTRIYRLVLDKNKRYVQKIGATGISAPMNSPMGASFNFDASTPLNQSNNQISINFRCAGALYQDDILVWAFNQTVAKYNSYMADKNFSTKRVSQATATLPAVYQTTHTTYKQIPYEALDLFNNRGYPRIEPETYELQWWVPPDLYKERYGIYLEQAGKS